MKNKTLQIIKKYGLIERDSHIIVGLSGGPDSVCLFDVLFRIAEENPQLNWKLYAVHVNHKLREGAAEEDQRYVEELCAARKVPCRVAVTDCKALAAELGMTSEEAGRKYRGAASLQVTVRPAQSLFRKKKSSSPLRIMPTTSARQYFSA